MAVPTPDSSPWTQQPRVSQQAICPPSLSRGLRWRSACWLHEVPKPPATAHRVWHFGGRRSKKFSFQKLLSAPPRHLFHVEMSDTHSVGSPPDPGGLGVSHADQQSGGGDLCPAASWERRRGSRGGGVREVQTTPRGYALVSVGLASVSLSLR